MSACIWGLVTLYSGISIQKLSTNKEGRGVGSLLSFFLTALVRGSDPTLGDLSIYRSLRFDFVEMNKAVSMKS